MSGYLAKAFFRLCTSGLAAGDIYSTNPRRPLFGSSSRVPTSRRGSGESFPAAIKENQFINTPRPSGRATCRAILGQDGAKLAEKTRI